MSMCLYVGQSSVLDTAEIRLSLSLFNSMHSSSIWSVVWSLCPQGHFGDYYFKFTQLCINVTMSCDHCCEVWGNIYEGYSESKYRLRISLAHPRDCPFAHVQ